MKQFKSFSHVAKLLGLGLKEPQAEATVPTSAIVARSAIREPYFQTSITRKDQDIDVLVEIVSMRKPDGIDRRFAGEQMDDGEVIFGNCFTLQGEYISLSDEEVSRIEKEFRS